MFHGLEKFFHHEKKGPEPTLPEGKTMSLKEILSQVGTDLRVTAEHGIQFVKKVAAEGEAESVVVLHELEKGAVIAREEFEALPGAIKAGLASFVEAIEPEISVRAKAEPVEDPAP